VRIPVPLGWVRDGVMPYDVEHVAGSVPIKMWTRGVPVEDEARVQLANAARLPIVFKQHIAAMPDVHWGIGATVGSVIPTLELFLAAWVHGVTS
jgi:tRNA-splicing ligase RtcB (3'-phosphate/5'-hydroxy nucleic acid ligase)